MSDENPKQPRSLDVIARPNAKLEELRSAPTVDRPAAASQASPTGDHLTGERLAVHGRVVAALETVYDPEIPLNIYDLGLVYGIDVDDESQVRITMTLTAPACPMADVIVREVQQKVAAAEGVRGVKVDLVWSPPWDKSRMSEAAMLELGLL